jgi:hypothetical protein
MKEIEAQYQEFLDNIVQKYRGTTFCYNPPVSSEDADLTLIGRNGLRLEFRDAKGNFDYLSIDDFLQLAQTQPKRPKTLSREEELQILHSSELSTPADIGSLRRTLGI